MTNTNKRNMIAHSHIHDFPLDLEFTTSQQYNKVYNQLITNTFSNDAFIDIDNGHEKFATHASTIRSLYHPEENITVYEGHMRMLTVVFEDKREINVVIQGAKRAKNAYELIRPFLHKTETLSFISFLQEDNKYALIKHDSRIIGIFLDKIESDAKRTING